jgi:hypothetical protein
MLDLPPPPMPMAGVIYSKEAGEALKDGGGDWQTAVAILGEQGLASPGIDAIAHAVAGMRKRSYQDPPTFAPFVSAWGRVSGTRKHTILAWLAPPVALPKSGGSPLLTRLQNRT